MQGPEPHISVVIPCRNVATTLGEQLDALAAQRASRPFEVVVVDNASVDDTAGVAASFGDRLDIRIVTCPRPGLSATRNAGIRAARSPRIAMCDGDDVVAAGWVDAMAEALQRHPYVTGPVDLDGLNPPELARSRGTAGATGLPHFQGVFSFARGGNLGIHRALLDEIGWFDEATSAPDDQELGLRLHLAGVVPRLAADAVVQYRYRDDARSIWHQGLSYGASRVALFREVRRVGLDAPSRVAGWRSWVWLPLNVATLRSRAGRLAWLWVAANRLGHVIGSIRHRELYL